MQYDSHRQTGRQVNKLDRAAFIKDRARKMPMAPELKVWISVAPTNRILATTKAVPD